MKHNWILTIFYIALFSVCLLAITHITLLEQETDVQSHIALAKQSNLEAVDDHITLLEQETDVQSHIALAKQSNLEAVDNHCSDRKSLRLWEYYHIRSHGPRLYDAVAMDNMLYTIFSLRYCDAHCIYNIQSLTASQYSAVLYSKHDNENAFNGNVWLPADSVVIDPHGHTFIVKFNIGSAYNASKQLLVTLHMGTEPILYHYDMIRVCHYSEKKVKYNLAVCTMVQNSYPGVNALLLPWLLYHFKRGVEIVYMYPDQSNNEYLISVLDQFIQSGRVVVHEWTWPETGYIHQQVQQESCLYRLRGQARWVALIDVDEFIVPLLNNNKTNARVELVEFLDLHVPPQFAGVQIKSAFVKMDTQQNAFENVSDTNALQSLLSGPIIPLGREKCIVRPELVDAFSVHMITVGGEVIVPDAERELKINHFRRDINIPVYTTMDHSMDPFMSELASDLQNLL
jgi:hypothetical protein